MVYKIAAGISFILLGVSMLGLISIPVVLTGLALLVAGIALLTGY